MKSIFRFIAAPSQPQRQKFTTARFYSQRRCVKRRQDRHWILTCGGGVPSPSSAFKQTRVIRDEMSAGVTLRLCSRS